MKRGKLGSLYFVSFRSSSRARPPRTVRMSSPAAASKLRYAHGVSGANLSLT